MYNVTISPVLNGWKAEVGCQTLVFTDMDEMLKELKRYLKDPVETEKLYREKAVNAKHVFANENPPGAGINNTPGATVYGWWDRDGHLRLEQADSIPYNT